MGIHLGGSNRGAMADLNIVPLIDILLVLLIIFMVISPATPQGLQTAVPSPAPDKIESPPPAVVVQVLAGGNLKINQQDATWEGLGARLEQVFRGRADKVVFVQGDDSVLFEQVARAIDIVRGSGIDKVGLITNKLEAGQ